MALSKREKGLIVVAGLAMASAALWYGVWVPLDARATALQTERDLLTQMSDRLARLDALGIDPIARRPSAPLLDRVSRRAEESGLLLRQIAPEGPSLRVVTDELAFADLLAWLDALSQEDGVTAERANIVRQTQPGMVIARLTLGERR